MKENVLNALKIIMSRMEPVLLIVIIVHNMDILIPKTNGLPILKLVIRNSAKYVIPDITLTKTINA